MSTHTMKANAHVHCARSTSQTFQRRKMCVCNIRMKKSGIVFRIVCIILRGKTWRNSNFVDLLETDGKLDRSEPTLWWSIINVRSRSQHIGLVWLWAHAYYFTFFLGLDLNFFVCSSFIIVVVVVGQRIVLTDVHILIQGTHTRAKDHKPYVNKQNEFGGGGKNVFHCDANKIPGILLQVTMQHAINSTRAHVSK